MKLVDLPIVLICQPFIYICVSRTGLTVAVQSLKTETLYQILEGHTAVLIPNKAVNNVFIEPEVILSIEQFTITETKHLQPKHECVFLCFVCTGAPLSFI